MACAGSGLSKSPSLRIVSNWLFTHIRSLPDPRGYLSWGLSEQTSLKTMDSSFVNPLHWRCASLDFASFHPCPTLGGLLHSWGMGIILSYLVHPSLLPAQRSWRDGQGRMSFYRTVPLASIPGCSFLCLLL